MQAPCLNPQSRGSRLLNVYERPRRELGPSPPPPAAGGNCHGPAVQVCPGGVQLGQVSQLSQHCPVPHAQAQGASRSRRLQPAAALALGVPYTTDCVTGRRRAGAGRNVQQGFLRNKDPQAVSISMDLAGCTLCVLPISMGSLQCRCFNSRHAGLWSWAVAPTMHPWP